MKTLRIGNKIPIRWPILTNGEEVSLEGRNLTLYLEDKYGKNKKIETWEYEGNELITEIPALLPQRTGEYRLVLYENEGTDNQAVVDRKVFQLVAHSEDIPANMDTAELPISGSVLVDISAFTSVLRSLEKTKYKKPSEGIPSTDFTSDVQESLKRADSALQEHQDLSEYVNTVINVRWEELVAMADDNKLKAGQWYRISDYVTTDNGLTQLIGKYMRFDIIVWAESPRYLNETAYAIWHDGDNLLEGRNLLAWRLDYCLKNDSNRFAGVIDSEVIGEKDYSTVFMGAYKDIASINPGETISLLFKNHGDGNANWNNWLLRICSKYLYDLTLRADNYVLGYVTTEDEWSIEKEGEEIIDWDAFWNEFRKEMMEADVEISIRYEKDEERPYRYTIVVEAKSICSKSVYLHHFKLKRILTSEEAEGEEPLNLQLGVEHAWVEIVHKGIIYGIKDEYNDLRCINIPSLNGEAIAVKSEIPSATSELKNDGDGQYRFVNLKDLRKAIEIDIDDMTIGSEEFYEEESWYHLAEDERIMVTGFSNSGSNIYPAGASDSKILIRNLGAGSIITIRHVGDTFGYMSWPNVDIVKIEKVEDGSAVFKITEDGDFVVMSDIPFTAEISGINVSGVAADNMYVKKEDLKELLDEIENLSRRIVTLEASTSE